MHLTVQFRAWLPLVIVAFWTIGSAGRGACPTPGFSEQQAFPAGANPIAVSAADVNADHLPDIITANTAGRNVSVLLGMEDGGFAPKVDYSVVDPPFGLAVADVNGDTAPDIVAAVRGRFFGYVSVFVGRGDGTFVAPPLEWRVDPEPSAVVIGDFNGDTKPDIATSNQGQRVNNQDLCSVTVLLGDGTGGFGSLVDHLVGTGTYPNTLVTADLNGDTFLDIITTNRQVAPAGVRALLGDGAGGFGAPVQYDTPFLPFGVAVATVDGDTTPDLVVSSNSGVEGVGALSFMRGVGDGALAAGVSYDSVTFPYGLALGDVNGDGNLDAVAADYDKGVIGVLLGDGNGAFAVHVDFPVEGNPNGVALADLNRDGSTDIVTANFNNPGTTSVLLNACEDMGSGGLTAADIGKALQEAAGLLDTPAADLERYDLLDDERITLEDAALVARMVAGLDA